MGKYDCNKFKPQYFGFRYVIFLINALSKKNCAMRRGMMKPHGLKVRCYAACMVGVNEYLDTLPGAKENGKIGEMELNKIILKSMQNVWSSQA